MLVASNFSFYHNVIYTFEELSAIFIKLRFTICKLFQFGKVENLLFGNVLNTLQSINQLPPAILLTWGIFTAKQKCPLSICCYWFFFRFSLDDFLIWSHPKSYRLVESDVSCLFCFRFRWGFPEFPQRVHIALGLLEYAFTAMEEENSRFYMCDFSTQNFGYTQYYHMKVSNVQGIVSESVLNRTLSKIRCEEDSACIYGSLCKSTCNKDTRQCRGIGPSPKPDLVMICEILFEYILYGTPNHLKDTLQQLISQCYRIGRNDLGKSEMELQIEQNFVIDHINNILWKELKDEKNPWMYRPTPSPFRK